LLAAFALAATLAFSFADSLAFAFLATPFAFVASCFLSLASRCFWAQLAPDDKLFKMIEQASAAMHSLAIHTHYAPREKVKQRPKPE